MYADEDCWITYQAAESDLKRLEEDFAFEDFIRTENREQRRDNLMRQERRNISMKARGDNHYRKTHSAQIKARKGWR